MHFKLIVSLSVLALSSINVSSQESQTILKGDTLILNLNSSEAAFITWQKKNDLLQEWIDIPNSNTTGYRYVVNDPDSLLIIRAKINLDSSDCAYFTERKSFKLYDSLEDIQLGDSYNNTTVFYKSSDTLYLDSKIVLGSLPWSCEDSSLDDVLLTNIGSGKLNTEKIVSSCENSKDTIYLAKECYNLKHFGYDDWFIPSFDEMLKLIEFYGSIPDRMYHTSSTTDFFGPIGIQITSGALTIRDALSNRFLGHCIPIRIAFGNERSKYEYTFDIVDSNDPSLILISYDHEESTIDVMYDGNYSSQDSIVWTFGDGEVLQGSGKGPIKIGYSTGFWFNINMVHSAPCDTVVISSDLIRVPIFNKVNTDLPKLLNSDIKSVDINLDGFTDIFLSGSDTTTMLLNNNGSSFNVLDHVFPNLKSSMVDFGDVNNDGFPDLFLSGYSNKDSSYQSFLYKNIAGTSFAKVESNFPELSNGFCQFVDYNNDGLIDLFLSGMNSDSLAQSVLVKNLGNFKFEFQDQNIHNLAYSAGEFADYNKDGFSDLLICGSEDTIRYSYLYENRKGTFYNTEFSIPPINNGSVNWSDYNNDGLLDFSIAGMLRDVITYYDQNNSAVVNTEQSVFANYFIQNDSTLFSTASLGSGGSRFINSSHKSGDYDNDGLSDIFISGTSGLFRVISGTGGENLALNPDVRDSKTVVYKNYGDSFRDVVAELTVVRNNNNYTSVTAGHHSRSLEIFDFNNDNKLDVIREGGSETYPTDYFINKSYKENLKPNPPNTLSFEFNCDSLILHWNDGTDDLMPSHALNYDIWIGSNPDSSNILSKVNDYNVTTNNFTLNRKLEPGMYYWAVRSKDNAKNFSVFSEIMSIELGVTTPIISEVGNTLISNYADGNQWYSDTGIIPNATEQEYTPTESGSYYVVVSNGDCFSDPSNVIDFVLTDIEEIYKQNYIEIFPNPAKGKVTLRDTGKGGNTEYSIVDELGRIISKGSFKDSKVVPLDEFTNGVYLILINHKEGTETHKLVVSK